MTDRKRRKPPLVADRRYPAAGKPGARSGAKSARKPASSGKGTQSAKRTGKKARTGRGAGGGGKGGGGVLGWLGRLIGAVIGWILRLIWAVTWRITAVVALLVALGVAYVYSTLPEPDAVLDQRARGSVTMLDRNGEVFAWRGEQFGGVITADTVSPHLKHAIIATEDKRFYRHFGVSPRGVASAVRINLREGRGPLSGHGGSTITQQTAKLLCLGEPYDPASGRTEAEYEADCRRTTLWRKVKEAVFAMAMEVKYSKDEILTIYMNRAFLGAGARGFEAASQRYFDKSSAQLSASEAAMLAGLLVAPTRFAPTNSLSRAQNRANVIIGLMEDQEYLSGEQADQARAHPAQLSQAAAERAGGYFADWVMEKTPDYFARNTTEDVVIRTTLDRRLQAAAEEAMKVVFQEKVSDESKAQAAIVVMSADGAVRAIVGGRETRVSGVFNRATQARRQTGSAFKPFIYATALDLGYSPLDTVVDEPFCMDIPGSGRWCPENYSHRYAGRVTLTDALKRSLNIPAVKISESVGRESVRKVASDFGIESDLAAGPALALGASEATLIEMTGAYAGILNGGSSVTPYGLMELKLLGDDQPLMGATGGIGERVIRQDAARQLIWMLEKVVTEGTGTRARLDGWQAAGKTGTSQEARDAWFIGFTSQYVAGVWMGYDDNTPLQGVTGSGLPAEIWHETMVRVHDGLAPVPLPLMVPTGPTQPREPGNVQPGTGGGLGKVVDNVLRDLFGGGRGNNRDGGGVRGGGTGGDR